MRKAGYATDVRYPQKLIYLIEKHKLYQYDTPSNIASKGKRKPISVVTSDVKKHIVKKGDTLYSISRKYFVSVEDLMRINKMRSANLAIGQEVTLK